MSSKWRLLAFAGKAIVAALLIGWLIRSGALDPGSLAALVEQPQLLAISLAVFAAGVALGALRWRGLLRLADVELPFGRALRWHLIGLLFSVIVPGNVGGDVVKSLYVLESEPPAKRAPVFLIALIDRAAGLAGLAAVAAIAIAARGAAAWADPALRPLAIVIVAFAAATLVAPLAVLALVHVTGDRLERRLDGTRRLGRLLAQLVSTTRLIARRPRALVTALALSIAIHALGAALFATLTAAILHRDVALSAIATIYPLGMVTIALPVSPAGLGVGHLAFDRLFALWGLSGGATVFNVYVVSQIMPCLLGAIPYIAARRRG